MPIFQCSKKCCTLKNSKYINEKEDLFEKIYYSNSKAGVVIFDPKSSKVLLVQSRGHLWGPPKGTLLFGETKKECAVREVKEETGLTISADSFSAAATLSNKAIYFYMEMSECDVYVQNHLPGNDANGIGWVNLSCLKDFVKNGNICLSKHCQIALKRLLNVTFEHPLFTLVQRSKK